MIRPSRLGPAAGLSYLLLLIPVLALFAPASALNYGRGAVITWCLLVITLAWAVKATHLRRFPHVSWRVQVAKRIARLLRVNGNGGGRARRSDLMPHHITNLAIHETAWALLGISVMIFLRGEPLRIWGLPLVTFACWRATVGLWPLLVYEYRQLYQQREGPAP